MHNKGLSTPGSGIPLGMSTIADKLRSVGYRTHAVGKWHCGFATPAQTPLGRGFDSYFGCKPQHPTPLTHPPISSCFGLLQTLAGSMTTSTLGRK